MSIFVRTIQAIHFETGKPVKIGIEAGLIASIEEIAGFEGSLFLAPGFIDNQINGYNKIGFANEGLKLDAVYQVIREMYKQGVTSFLPTLITTPFKCAIKNFEVLGGVFTALIF